MNGAIVRYGEQLGITIPVNSFLTDMVLALEKLNVLGNKEMNAAERNHCEL
jgi:ketopantoate reductase